MSEGHAQCFLSTVYTLGMGVCVTHEIARRARRALAIFFRRPRRKLGDLGLRARFLRDDPEEHWKNPVAAAFTRMFMYVNASDTFSLICLFAFLIYFPVFSTGFSDARGGDCRGRLSACRVVAVRGGGGLGPGRTGDKEAGSWRLSSFFQPCSGHASAWRF